MNTGLKIKRYRLKNNWTQQMLADKSKLAVSRIQHYEIGFRTPKKDNLIKIASALNIKPYKLKGYDISSFEEAEEVLNDITLEFGKDFIVDYLNKLE